MEAQSRLGNVGRPHFAVDSLAFYREPGTRVGRWRESRTRNLQIKSLVLCQLS